MKGVGHASGGSHGVPISMLLHAPYHKEQEILRIYNGLAVVFGTVSRFCILSFSYTNAHATKFDHGLQ